MALIDTSHDSLPYIDPAPTPQQRTAITSLITACLAPEHLTTPHPLLPALPPSTLSPLLEQEIARHASNEPLAGGIDTSRYEALGAPNSANPADHHNTLQKAYASSTYLYTRNQNLALLEQFGKNAWLVGNSQLEDILRNMERELVDVSHQIEEVNKLRKSEQEGVRGEMEGLEGAWKKGVGGVVETEIAAEGLRLETLRQRREGARR
ncbi:MAG: hypothetical protein M1813_005156 [Trichoglossum hirsutum]|nr:MAG: hypothetical protein M1813_005156 [Trichoglossum hirsutum]